MNKKKEKKHIMPGVILVAFLASVATFFLLLNMEKEALRDYEKVEVWMTGCQLAKGMEMTEGSVTQCLVLTEVDKAKVPGELVEDPFLLVGKRTEIELPAGTILSPAMFSEEDTYIESLYNPVIAGCKGDDLFQLVSGVLRKGDFVHIYTVNEELGETYLLWENIMVHQSFDASGNAIASEDIATPAARVNLLLEEGYTEQFYNELNAGSLRLVKVWQ